MSEQGDRQDGCRDHETCRKLKHREKLLQDIASGLAFFEEREVACLEVVFMRREDGEPLWTGGVAKALDVIVNDVYWDENNDWSDADVASVRVL